MKQLIDLNKFILIGGSDAEVSLLCSICAVTIHTEFLELTLQQVNSLVAAHLAERQCQ